MGAVTASITSTNANVSAANAKIATLDANLGTATTNITTLFANAASQQTTMAGLRTDVDYIVNTSLPGVVSVNSVQNTRMDTFEANLGQRYTEIQTGVTNLGLATTDITALKANAAAQATQISDVNTSIVDLYANAAGQASAISTLTANAAAQATDIAVLYANAATQSSAIAGKANTSSLAAVATSGSYTDLSNKPTIPAQYSGDLAGNVIYDSVRGRFIANAYPLSTPDGSRYANGFTNYIVNTPTYSNGVLQYSSATGVASQGAMTYGGILSANVALQSAYGTGGIKQAVGFYQYNQITPVTANVMNQNDRVRGGILQLDLNLNGQTWGISGNTYSQGAVFAAAGGAVAQIIGPGTIGSLIASINGVNINPAPGLQSNIQYATGTHSVVSFNSNATTAQGNVVNARLFAGGLSGFSGNNTVVNAIGLHTYNGWAGTIGTTSGAKNAYALLNEDTSTLIQTSGNIVFASGSGKGIVFSDGTVQTTAASGSGGSGTYGDANVAAYLSAALAQNVDTYSLTSGNISSRGSISATTGFFWSNGTPYSTGSGNASTGNISFVNTTLTPTTDNVTLLKSYTGNVISQASNFISQLAYVENYNSITTGNIYATSRRGSYAFASDAGIFGGAESGPMVGFQLQPADNAAGSPGQQYYHVMPQDGRFITAGNVLIGQSNVLTNGFGGVVSNAGVVFQDGTFQRTAARSFAGDLAGSVVYDSVLGRNFTNAYPLSTPTIGTSVPGSSSNNFLLNGPVYSGGVLQYPPTQVSGVQNVSSVVFGQVVSGNVAINASGQTAQNRNTVNQLVLSQFRPTGANSFGSSDRVRSSTVVTDLILSGQTWGFANSSSQSATAVTAAGSQTSLIGYGTVGSMVGTTGAVQVCPTNGTANVQYATGLLASISVNSVGGAQYAGNIAYARGLSPTVSGFTANLTVQNAVGLHTPSGWAGTVGSSTAGAKNAYALLNEDALTQIQTNGPITTTGGTGNVTVGGNLTVGNNSTFGGPATFNGTTTIAGTLSGATRKQQGSYNVTRTTATVLDNVQAIISTEGWPQVAGNGSTLTYYASAQFLVGGQTAATRLQSAGSTGAGTFANVVASVPYPLATAGDTVIAYVQDSTAGKMYRITYAQTVTAGSGYVVIEQI